MNNARSLIYIVLSLVCALIMSACAGSAVAPSPTPTLTPTITLTATVILTATSTSTPTLTPSPTATEKPPTSTAAPMGETVSTNDYEVDVITMRTLPSVYDNNLYEWVPKDGYMFVELGIKVVNLNPGTDISVRIGKINVIEENGSIWHPSWGFAKPVARGIDVAPKSLTLLPWDNLSIETVDFDEVVVIRTVYIVKKLSPTTLLFRFGDSPLIEVVVP